MYTRIEFDRFRPRPLVIAILCAIVLPGCVSLTSLPPTSTRLAPPSQDQTILDPFEGFNRGVYAFNEGVDKAIIGPAARGYTTVVPRVVRKRVTNFSRNLGEPISFLNEILQFDLDDAGVAFSRFFINSTVGVGGLFDVASKNPDLIYKGEDLGQTLGTYGIESGPYLVLPLLGPSNFRDITGRVGDIIANPVTFIDFRHDTAIRGGVSAASGLDARARFDGRIESFRNAADPYVNLRTIYNQNRENNIHEDSDPFDDLADFE